MTKKRLRGFTADGFVRVQRTVLRRVVCDRLQALLRGDFYVRNHLGEEDYDPIVKEVEALNVPSPLPQVGGEGNAAAAAAAGGTGQTNGSATNAANANGTTSTTASASAAIPRKPQSPLPPTTNTFTPKLETFIQLIAASIMIDASMRGENAGESDTRFIKKKKKILAKTLQGPKLGDFRKEVLRFDMIQQGKEFEEEEIVESEESKSSGSSSEEESEEEEEEEEEFEVPKKKKKARKFPPPQPAVAAVASHASHAASEGEQSSSEEEASQEEEEEEEADSTLSDSGATSSLNSRSNSTLDGFSTSATSSKHQKKKDKKRKLKKERKKLKKEERRRLKKERKRREKEEKRKKRKREKEAKRGKSGKKRRKVHHSEEGYVEHDLLDGHAAAAEDAQGGHAHSSPQHNGGEPSTTLETSSTPYNGDNNEPQIYEIASKQDFDRYKADLLSRVPRSVKCRFREGGFSRWGKDWLPILELGPFDVEPGPVRDMWLEMFDNTQENGRDMTRLVFWYGVKFEDRGQAYSFVPEGKIVQYEEGVQKGYCKMPKKIQKKIEKKQKLTKTEEQLKRGLKEIEADMELDKSDRAAWMMQFKEDYELAEEEAAKEEADQKLKSQSVGEMEMDDERVEEEEMELAPVIPKKRKPGRPRKDESLVAVAAGGIDKPIKRKPGRPKKVVEAPLLDGDGEVVKVKKKGPGRPKKSDKEKAEKAAEKARAKAAAAAKKKHKQSTAKKWHMVDEDHESEMETDDDDDDRDYDEDAESDDGIDFDVDEDDEDSDAAGESKKRKASTSEKKSKKKSKSSTAHMTEEEKAIERRARAAEYREKKARERAEAQGLEYVKGRVGRKSKETILNEEQMKFTKCEEVFCPMMERLDDLSKDENANVKSVLKCINSVMDRVELLTPPFLRLYPLGMLVKSVRKSFEGAHPEVKDRCKRLTAEMKRVYTEKEKKIPDGFEPVKNKKSTKQQEESSVVKLEPVAANAVTESAKSEKAAMIAEKVGSTAEDGIVIKSEKIAVKSEKADNSIEQSIPKRNSEMSLSEPMPRKPSANSSSECQPDTAVKSEQQTQHQPQPQLHQPKQKKTFSIKGMFEKPKPAPKPKIAAPVPSMIVSGQPSPRTPKALPSWVTGPAMKMEDFHEQHAKERSLGLEFLVDAASLVTLSNSKKFDPISVSQSFELAIFAETKLRGRNWQQYWEKVHDVVSMLSPGRSKPNAILQGIISGDYQEPSELVKLSRREIQSLNRLKS